MDTADLFESTIEDTQEEEEEEFTAAEVLQKLEVLILINVFCLNVKV